MWIAIANRETALNDLQYPLNDTKTSTTSRPAFRTPQMNQQTMPIYTNQLRTTQCYTRISLSCQTTELRKTVILPCSWQRCWAKNHIRLHRILRVYCKIWKNEDRRISETFHTEHINMLHTLQYWNLWWNLQDTKWYEKKKMGASCISRALPHASEVTFCYLNLQHLLFQT
jgi:hypothetical protein